LRRASCSRDKALRRAILNPYWANHFRVRQLLYSAPLLNANLHESLPTGVIVDLRIIGELFVPTPIPQTFQGAAFEHVELVVSPTQLLDGAAVEQEDDDYFDVDSEDEMVIPAGQTMVSGRENQRDFAMILAIHRENTSDIGVRRYDAFIYNGILNSYRAEWHANPLKNAKTARVFAHFIHSTGPSLSIYERNVRNPNAIFSDQPIPSSQQSLWTYTLPMMALNHQGLLHAMLALASLHIAKLQGASITPSYKHYAYALKRIHHAVGHAKRRHLPSTLAATLLLGFYEVMTADHLKWSSHLIGAKQLLIETDYPGMTMKIRKMKAEADQLSPYEMPLPHEGTYFNQASNAIDELIVSTLIGRKLRYDDFGHVVEDMSGKAIPSSMPQQLDLSKYELYQDLFWWYARQDAYQSIISGNRLL